MSAATENRNTVQLPGPNPITAFLILNAAIIFAGSMVAVDYADEVQPAADTAGLKVIGCAGAYVDNTADGKSLRVECGIYRYENSSTSPVPRSAIGQVCYVEDNTTVAGTTTNLVPAGIVRDIDADGVYVDQTPEALAAAWERRPCKRVAKTDDYTVTAAIAFEGRTFFACDKASIMEITLPTAVAGMRVGVQRGNATAAHDVTIQAAAGDTIEASDATCAAGKQIDNTTDAVSAILWLRAMDDTAWRIDNPVPTDVTSWVKNDA